MNKSILAILLFFQVTFSQEVNCYADIHCSQVGPYPICDYDENICKQPCNSHYDCPSEKPYCEAIQTFDNYWNPISVSVCKDPCKGMCQLNGVQLQCEVTLSPEYFGYYCICPRHYKGLYCEIYDPCNTDPTYSIPNSLIQSPACSIGSCMVTNIGSYSCVVDGSCDMNPCMNGGFCMQQGGNNFMCECIPGFEGSFCENFVLPV
jgi:hypothetical protein